MKFYYLVYLTQLSEILQKVFGETPMRLKSLADSSINEYKASMVRDASLILLVFLNLDLILLVYSATFSAKEIGNFLISSNLISSSHED